MKHREAEKALQESEEKYRNLVVRANDSIVIVQDGLLKFANPRLSELAGYSIKEALEAPFTKFIHPEEVSKIVSNYERRMKEESVPAIYETALLHKDGRRIEVEINAGTIAFQGRKADLIFIRDISRRKEAERAIRRSEEKYRRIVETSEEGVWRINKRSITTFVNQRMAAMLGYSVEEMLGRSVFRFMDEEWREWVLEKYSDLEEIEREQYEFKFRRKDGSEIWTLVNTSPIYDDQARLVGDLAMVMDITERKKA